MRRVFAAALLAVALGGCAVAVPALTFGSTTPHRRTDVAAGGAARIARGAVRASANGIPDLESTRGTVDATGIVPTAVVRYGLGERLDLGLTAAGTAFRIDLRTERELRQGSTRVALVYGLAPSYGYLDPVGTDEGAGHRIGLEPVLALGIDFGGLYDVWAGPRLIVDGLVGRFEDAAGVLRDARGTRLDVGGVFGIAAGLRRVHAYLEISVLHERWWGRTGTTSFDRDGLVLLPAFGLRLRL